MKNVLVKRWPHRYPVVLEKDAKQGTYAGFAVDMPVYAWGKASRAEVRESLARGLSLFLAELEARGQAVPMPTEDLARVDLTGLCQAEVVWLEPAPMNPVSLELEQALRARGLSQRELARRMGTTPSAVHRLLDPFYFGHSLESLRRVAEALGVGLEVRLTA